MKISFIILSWNSERYLTQCIASITHALERTGFSYEILILDNGSSDRSRPLLEELAAQFPNQVKPRFESRNLGTTRSRNLLFSVAQGELLCVLDSDVEFAPGVISRLLPHLASGEVGIVVPRVVYPSGRWQKSFDRFPTLFDKIVRFFRLRAMERSEGASIDEQTAPFPVDYAISAFWLMPRRLLSVVGPLDERIFYAPEDVDFCLRVWQAGYRIVYVPEVSVVHHTQEISRGFKLNRAKLSHIKGLAYYFLKHRYVMRRPSFSTAKYVPPTERPG
jgi:GT2 family glycosyltransferase